jgi:hypothetical protein
MGYSHLIAGKCSFTDDALHEGVYPEALWFLGSGIAIILAGIINMMLLITRLRSVQMIAAIVNMLMTVLFAIATKAVTEPQVYIGIYLFGTGVVLSLLFRKPIKHPAGFG